ncbi:MAG: CHAT domain-containing protein [Actinomycetes bacterium]
MVGLQKQAEEALRLASVDPPRATALAQTVLAQARSTRSWECVCLAERALGVAAMHQSQLEHAIGHLRAAVTAGRRAGTSGCVGEARMSLAGVLLMCGKPARSFRQIALALNELDGVPAARARVQRAAMLQELGRLDDALEDLRRALPVLRRAGDAQWATRALSNRGLLHIARREFGAAETDLLAARQLCSEHELVLPVAIVEHNLAWMESQRGEVPAALRHLSAAESMFQELGMPSGSLLTDRAELLLSVRLLDEARQTAQAAVDADARDGRVNHLPEAQLLLSTILLVHGDAGSALDAAEAAVDGFVRLRRREWLALARFARIQALLALDRPVTAVQCRRAADALEEAGWPVPALEARLRAGGISLESGNRRQARRDFQRASRARRVGPADARVRAWLAEAMLREADGRPRAAVAALRAGMRVLEDYRATMGATELRAHVTLLRGGTARRGLRLALGDRDARRVLWWAESSRATSALPRRVHPPQDPVLADLLAQLRAVMSRIEERRAGGLSTSALVHEQVALERRIRDHCRELQGPQDRSRTGPVPLRDLRDALGETVLVEFGTLDQRMHAVTVTGSRVRLHDLGDVDVVPQQVGYVNFALRRLAMGAASAASLDAAEALLRTAASRLEEVLLGPIRREVGDGPLVVVPDGALQGIPWSLLPSCARRAVSVSPSASLWHAAATREANVGGRVVSIAGPGLPGARMEAVAVARRYEGSTALVDDEATAANVSAALDGATLAHLSAHGSLRSDNPMFSSLQLADGPFTVYDLERIERAPHHVVLAACDTGQSHVVAGNEILGFTAALLGGGACTLVAPVVPVADSETLRLMQAYHDGLRLGLGSAQALADAQHALADDDHASRASAAAFVCLGFGGSVFAGGPPDGPDGPDERVMYQEPMRTLRTEDAELFSRGRRHPVAGTLQ